MHILIIEEQKADRYILKKTLSPFFDVTTLSSAREAVTFAIDNTFDIVLISSGPHRVSDSIEVLYDLQFSQTKFISYIISNSLLEEQENRLIEAGFKEILRKPFELERFIELLKKEEYKFNSYASYININREPALF